MKTRDYRDLLTLMLDGASVRDDVGEPARLVRLLTEALPRSEARRLLDAIEAEGCEHFLGRGLTVTTAEPAGVA